MQKFAVIDLFSRVCKEWRDCAINKEIFDYIETENSSYACRASI